MGFPAPWQRGQVSQVSSSTVVSEDRLCLTGMVGDAEPLSVCEYLSPRCHTAYLEWSVRLCVPSKCPGQVMRLT